MKILMSVLMLVSGALAHADEEKIYSCKIKDKKYSVELTYPEGETQIPTHMKVFLEFKGKFLLQLSGSPVVHPEYNWTSDGPDSVRKYVIELVTSGANRVTGYTIYLSEETAGLDTNETWGAKESKNCELKN